VKRSEAGVSLLEILVSLLLVSLALVPLLQLYPGTLGFQLDSEFDLRLSAAAVRKTEEVIGLLRLPAGTIEFDAAASRGSAGPQSSTSAPMTLGANANYVVVQIGIRGTTLVTSVTVGGAAASRILARNNAANNRRSELWGLANPPTGPVTVTVTLAAGVKHAWIAASFSGVQTAAPLGANGGNDGNSREPNVTVNPRTADTLLVGGFLWDFGGGTITQGAGQTAIGTDQTTGGGAQVRTHLARETTAGGAGTDMTWRVSGSARPWIALATELRGGSLVANPAGSEACPDLPGCLLVWTTGTELSSGVPGIGALRVLNVVACEDADGNSACDTGERQVRYDAKVTSRP